MTDEASLSDLQNLIREVWPKVCRAYESTTGRAPSVNLGRLSVSVHSDGILPGKIGRHLGPKDGLKDRSVLLIHPKAFSSPAYLKVVVAHELTHFAFSNQRVDSHGPEFLAVMEALGIPKPFRD